MDLVQLDIDDRGDVVIASVSGELDLAGAPSTGDATGHAWSSWLPGKFLGERHLGSAADADSIEGR